MKDKLKNFREKDSIVQNVNVNSGSRKGNVYMISEREDDPLLLRRN